MILFLFQLQLRNTGFSDSQIVEICAALSVLAKYGILPGLGLGSAHAGGLPVSSYLGVMEQATAANANTGAVFGPIGPVGLGDCHLGRFFLNKNTQHGNSNFIMVIKIKWERPYVGSVCQRNFSHGKMIQYINIWKVT